MCRYGDNFEGPFEVELEVYVKSDLGRRTYFIITIFFENHIIVQYCIDLVLYMRKLKYWRQQYPAKPYIGLSILQEYIEKLFSTIFQDMNLLRNQALIHLEEITILSNLNLSIQKEAFRYFGAESEC